MNGGLPESPVSCAAERQTPEQEARLRAAWARPAGWRRFSAVNNSIVGAWYTLTALGFFLFAGVLALLMRTQLAVPDNDFVSAELYDQLFTLHGSVMMFLFAVPVFEAFAIMMLPQMMGTRELPFPRLSAFGYWSFLIGGVYVCGSIFFGAAPSGGWFMYPPMTTRYSPGVGADIWLLGLSFIEIASLAAAVELIVGVLRCRAPGVRLDRMPLYGWYLLVVGGMILFAFPPLIAGDLLFELERAFDWPFFDPERGGDPLLWQHLFWIFGHPEVYIVFLPAVALIAMIVPTFAQTPMVGHTWVVLSAVGIGFLSFGLWVHHMFTTGLPAMSLAFFSAASQAVAIPTAVQIFCFIATVFVGRLQPSVPMLFATGALAIFVLGGLTGVMVAIAPFDFQAHDTYFVVAHLHYVLFGGMVFPIVAGLYYYLPMFSGRMANPKLGRIAFWTMFAGFNVAFLPMHLTGLAGMVRRVYTYSAESGFGPLNLVSTIGAYVLAAGIAVVIYDLVAASRKGARVRHNPWNAGTLEWLPEIPGALWGMRSIPQVRSRYPLWDQPGLAREVEEGRWYLADAREGLRETLITSTVDARPVQCLRVPGPSYLPLAAAALTGAAFIAAVYHWWWVGGVSGIAAIAAIMAWLWTGTGLQAEASEKDVGCGLRLPLYCSGPDSVGWWGLLITLIGDSTAFVSLVFAYFYYWTVDAGFLDRGGPSGVWIGAGVIALSVSWLLTRWAVVCNRRSGAVTTTACLAAGALCGCGAMAAWYLAPSGLDPTSHAFPAMVWVMVLWVLLHAGIGLLMQVYCIARVIAGRLNGRFDADIQNTLLYWNFLTLTAAVAGGLLVLFPETVQ